MTYEQQLEPKKVMEVRAEDGGWRVLLECGHESWWAIEPPIEYASCSQCLNDVVEALKKEKAS